MRIRQKEAEENRPKKKPCLIIATDKIWNKIIDENFFQINLTKKKGRGNNGGQRAAGKNLNFQSGQP